MAFLSTFVGVGQYADPGIRELTGASRDAIALYALFSDSIPDCASALLVGKDASLEKVKAALTDTLGSAGPDDAVVFFFSGHGSHDHRLAMFDTRLDALADTTISMDELADLFKNTKAKTVLCVLDCCFSGGAPAKVLEDSPIPKDPGWPLEVIAGEGRVLLAACAVNEIAYELPTARHGLLTKSLIDVLIQTDQPIDLLTAMDQVMKAVRANANQLGITQTPVMLGSVVGGMVLPPLKPGKMFATVFPEYQGAEISNDFADLVSLGFPSVIIDEWKKKYPGGLNDLQRAAINQHRVAFGNSLLVIAPTSAGKTFVGELAAAKAITEGRKAVFLLPYKALVNEKFDQFSELYGLKLGMRVIRCSGDYNDQVGLFLKGKYDLALLTYEMFLQLVVSSPAVLHQLGLVVIDEAQFVTDSGRGIAVELLLTFLLAAREKGIAPQLIALSAVIGDANNFHNWLGCDILYSTTRPVPLTEGVIDRNGTYQYLDPTGKEGSLQLIAAREIVVRRDKPSAQDLLVPLVRKLASQGEKVIVFRNMRGPAQGCAGYLANDLRLPPATAALALLPSTDLSGSSRALRQCLQGGTAFHNSNLTREERIVIEQAFRDPDGPVRALAATTTVAAGINTPASTVILAENEFVGEDGRAFTVAEYKNMAGRAGRLGFKEEGKAIIYAETPFERQALFSRYVRGQLERLHSSFDPLHIDTWLVRLLAQVDRVLRPEVVRMLANTYAGHLEIRRNPAWRKDMEGRVEALLDRMIKLGIVDTEADRVSLSLLGRACGRSSLSFDSAMRLIEVIRALPTGRITPEHLVALMQVLPDDEMGYTPMFKKGTRESARVNQLTQRYGPAVANTLQRWARDQFEYFGRCKRAAILFDWTAGVSVEEIEREYSTTPYAGRIELGDIRRFADLTRFHLRSASDILSVLLLGRNLEDGINIVLKQLEIGIPREAVELLDCGVALTRGQYLLLLRAGIGTLTQLFGTDPAQLKSLLGDQRVEELDRVRPKAEVAKLPF